MLEDLMEAAIADANKEKVVNKNVEEIPKDGNKEKDIEEKTTDEINEFKGNDTAHSQKDKNEADEHNKEDKDNLEEDKEKDKEHSREDEKYEEPKLNVLESDTNIAKTSNDENAGDGEDNDLEKDKEQDDKHTKNPKSNLTYCRSDQIKPLDPYG